MGEKAFQKVVDEIVGLVESWSPEKPASSYEFDRKGMPQGDPQEGPFRESPQADASGDVKATATQTQCVIIPTSASKNFKD